MTTVLPVPYAALVEREEWERAVDALFVLACAAQDEQRAALEALRARLAGAPSDRDRAVAAHGMVRLALAVSGIAAEARYMAAVALRESARAAGRPREWSYAALGRLWGVDRATAQTVLRRPRGEYPGA